MAFVTGISGRFPESSSLPQFWLNLVNGVDLVFKSRRYPTDNPAGLPLRIAQINDVEKFDSAFFGVGSQQANLLDPQVRMLLETVFEAIVDAGYSMADLKGSNTGVYVGACFSDLHKSALKSVSEVDLAKICGYENTGGCFTMFANRISFHFDFCGPSISIDTACSSSIVALDRAVQDLNSGLITRAVVCGASLITDPSITKSFQMYHMLSPDGECRSFDSTANGYVRADGVGALLVENAKMCDSQGILRILATGCNCDGWKGKGVTYPSASHQLKLFKQLFHRISDEPSEIGRVRYVEAHGTGTVAGDGVELSSISEFLCGYGQKVTPTLIGSVKSNMGHAEGASGLMSLIKVCAVVIENTIPGNLHYSSTHHDPIISGKLQVVAKTQSFREVSAQYDQPILMVNNFGFGGTNACVLCEPGVQESAPYVTVENSEKSRFIFGRTKHCLEEYVVKNNLNVNGWKKLLHSSSDTRKFPWRAVVSRNNEVVYSQIGERHAGNSPSIAFCYTGQGCQWIHMAKDLFQSSEVFRSVIRLACSDLPFPVKFNDSEISNIDELFESGLFWKYKEWSGLGITLTQIGLTAMLREAGIIPDLIFGHSVGEVACGYADGSMSAKDCANISFARCDCAGIADGLMMAVGLSEYDAELLICELKLCDTCVGCNNSPDGVTITGSEKEIMQLKAVLEERSVFARVVPTGGVAYHSLFFKRNKLTIETIIAGALSKSSKCRVPRSEKWISTNEGGGLYADTEYHVNNITGKVCFAPVVQNLPKGCIVIEIGPHSLLKSAILRCNSNVVYCSTMMRDSSGMDSLQRCIDQVWLSGGALIFPKFRSTLHMHERIPVEWDHQHDFRVAKYEDFVRVETTMCPEVICRTYTYNLDKDDSYLFGHIIQGMPLFPATGYAELVWRCFNNFEKPICIRNLFILEAVKLVSPTLTFNVSIMNGKFQVFHDTIRVACGDVADYHPLFKGKSNVIYSDTEIQSISAENEISRALTGVIEKPEVYQRLWRCGYQYINSFQCIQSVSGNRIKLENVCCWTVLLDNLLQAFIGDPSELRLPTFIHEIVIKDAKVLPEVHTECSICWERKMIGNAFVEIRGLETTAAKPKFPTVINHQRIGSTTVVVNNVKFVCYGGYVAKSLNSSEVALKQVDFRENPFDNSMLANRYQRRKIPGTRELNTVKKPLNYDVVKLEQLYSRMESEDWTNVLCTSVLSGDALYFTEICSIFAQIVRDQVLDVKVNILQNNNASIIGKVIVKEVEGLGGCVLFSSNTSVMDPVANVLLLDLFSLKGKSLREIESLLRSVPSGAFVILDTPCGHFSGSSNDYDSLPLIMGEDLWLKWLTELGLESVISVLYSIDDLQLARLVLLGFKRTNMSANDVDCSELQLIYRHDDIIVNEEDHEIQNQLLITLDFGDIAMVKSLWKESRTLRKYLQVCHVSTFGLSGFNGPNDELGRLDSIGFNYFNLKWTSLSLKGYGFIDSQWVLGGYHEIPLSNKDFKENLEQQWTVTRPGELSSITCNRVESTMIDLPCTEKILVGFCGLNFKDVMLSFGKLQADLPVCLGLEYSGVRISDHMRVMGLGKGCLASSLISSPLLSWNVPQNMDLAAAASIPVVYATVYYALVICADIQPGQTVLIHSVAGGVGQAAVRICQARGCILFGTCSVGKMPWVHEHLKLLPERVFDSRSTEFLGEVLLATGGCGVDVVLNSLSEDKLIASIECVARCGHYCEIGKYDIQQNSNLGMKLFSNGIHFHTFDLADIMSDILKPNVSPRLLNTWGKLWMLMNEGLISGEVQPITHQVTGDVEDGLRLLSSGKHLGKVIISVSAALQRVSTFLQTDSCFKTSGTHLVIGGLGGFGLEWVRYLYKCGAVHVVVVSRSAVKPWQVSALRGNSTIVSHANLCVSAECDELLCKLGDSLVGIWHTAGVLLDKMYENMDSLSWSAVVSPKVDISSNLDVISRKRNKNLKYFVLWSSVSSLFGNPGQTAYAYANARQEEICRNRHFLGLPGTAIQWGVIGDVGMATRVKVNDSLRFSPQSIISCVTCSMPLILTLKLPVVTSYIRNDPQSAAVHMDDEPGKKSLCQRIAEILGESCDRIKPTDTLSSLGMDSLQTVEIRSLVKDCWKKCKVDAPPKDIGGLRWLIIQEIDI